MYVYICMYECIYVCMDCMNGGIYGLCSMYGLCMYACRHVSFNVDNIGTCNVYSFLTRAGSSYSDLMTGLGYSDVQEREQLRAVYRLVMVWGGICGEQRTYLIVIDGSLTAHRYLHMEIIQASDTCSVWSNSFTFVMRGPV